MKHQMNILLIGMVKMQDSSIVKEAKYLSFVSNLIFKYGFDSLLKITIVALILYYGGDSTRKMRGKYNLIGSFFNNSKSILLTYHQDFYYIFKSVSLLAQNNYITIQDDKISINQHPQVKIPEEIRYKSLSLCLEKICSLTTKSFLFEVLSNV